MFPCIHEWVLTDVNQYEYYNGFDLEFFKEYEITCVGCRRRKVVDEINYVTMKGNGLIVERKAR